MTGIGASRMLTLNKLCDYYATSLNFLSVVEAFFLFERIPAPPNRLGILAIAMDHDISGDGLTLKLPENLNRTVDHLVINFHQSSMPSIQGHDLHHILLSLQDLLHSFLETHRVFGLRLPHVGEGGLGHRLWTGLTDEVF